MADFKVEEAENRNLMINEYVVCGVEVIIVVIDKEISNFTETHVVILFDIVDKAIVDSIGKDVVVVIEKKSKGAEVTSVVVLVVEDCC